MNLSIGNQTSNYLQGTGYGFAIPSGSTINGIIVVIKRYASMTGPVLSGTPVVNYGDSITCVASVMRSAGTNTPSGTVSWIIDGSGTFATSPCTLSGVGDTATCSVSYTPSAIGTGSHLITPTCSIQLNPFPPHRSSEQAETCHCFCFKLKAISFERAEYNTDAKT